MAFDYNGINTDINNNEKYRNSEIKQHIIEWCMGQWGNQEGNLKTITVIEWKWKQNTTKITRHNESSPKWKVYDANAYTKNFEQSQVNKWMIYH